MTSLYPPLSLYVHLPWCIKKCPYCDFNAHTLSGDLPETAYLEQLKRDLAEELKDIHNRPLRSIFFGGGTPSMMSSAFYRDLLAHIAKYITFAQNIEITLEANPGASDQANFAGYVDAGINRLSIGIQSFNETHLKALGRQHDSAMAKRAIKDAKQAGFRNINLDLMHALPSQTPAQAAEDLAIAVAMEPTHLSWYELTIEPNSVFFSYPPRQPDPDLWADVELQGIEFLAHAGFPRYEISAYANPDHHNQHNLNYWHFADYLAIGAGAHGKITRPDGSIWRYQKTRLPQHYLAEAGYQRRQLEAITPQDLPFEFMLNALRLTDGVPSELFSAATGLPLSTIKKPWHAMRQQQLMLNTDKRLGCTAQGLQFLNHVINQFS